MMTRAPQISVVIPVYNVMDKLDSCFNCLKNQTVFNQMEVIFVDDGSTDGSADLLDEFCLQHANSVCVHKQNGGVSTARNTGLSYTRGKYIGFIDADDIFDSRQYETLFDAAEQYSSDIAVIGFRIEMGGKWHYRYGTGRTTVFNRKEALESFLCERLIDASVCTKLFRREIISNQFFDELLAYGEDRRFVFDSLLKVDRVVHVDECLYDYKSNSESAMHTGFDRRRILMLDSVSEIRRIIHNNYPELDDQALCYELRCQAKTYEELLVGNCFNDDLKADINSISRYLKSFDYKIAVSHMLPRHYVAAWLLAHFPKSYIRLIKRVKY